MREPERVARTATAAPTAKVTAAGVAGTLTTLVVSLLARWAHWTVPPEVSAALVTLISFLAAYLTRPRPGEVVEFDQGR